MSDLLWDAFPTYLTYGMSTEEYWKGDPYLAVAYREHYQNRQENMNIKLWLQGMYIFEALSIVSYNENRKRGQQAKEYPKKPYPIFEKPLSEEEKAKRERAKFIASMNAMKAAWDKKNASKD